MDRKIELADLRPGMFVSQLDRPWLETPFMLQGFHIKDREDLERLEKYCSFVYINDEEFDPDLAGVDIADPAVHAAAPVGRYEDSRPVEEEITFAKEIYARTTDALSAVFSAAENGHKLEVTAIRDAVTQIADSVIRNPDALMWVRRIQKTDSYTFTRAMDSSIICIAFGRHLGLPRDDIEALGIGGLLLDVGKLRVPIEYLNAKRRLSDKEFAEVRRHVQYGVEMISETSCVPRPAIAMVANHHERFDGSGYPGGIGGEDIPLYGRIAGIVDCYSAITSERGYAPAMPQHEAIKALYEWRNRDFQDELIEKFIQTLGVYPTGTVVQLSDGSVAIVISQSRVRRLRPRLMMVLDTDKKPLGANLVVDLMVETSDVKGDQLNIECAVDPKAYDIDPAEFFL